MKTKPGQRVALYEITNRHEDAPEALTLGVVLVDRPRGEHTEYHFINMEKGVSSWVTATRLGFARMDADNKKTIAEPKLQAVLDARKAASA